MQAAIASEGEGRKMLESVLGENVTQQVFATSGSSIKSEFPVLAEIESFIEAIEHS